MGRAGVNSRLANGDEIKIAGWIRSVTLHCKKKIAKSFFLSLFETISLIFRYFYIIQFQNNIYIELVKSLKFKG